MSVLSTTTLIISLAPQILELIKVIEAAIPQNGAGKAKIEFLRTVLTEAIPNIQEIWGTVEKIVSAAVKLYNTTGVFSTSK